MHGPFQVKGAPNVFLDTVKRGEEDDFLTKSGSTAKSVVIRLYEGLGGHAKATLFTYALTLFGYKSIAESDCRDLAFQEAYLCDILERKIESIDLLETDGQSGQLDLHFKPFQVLTVKVVISAGLESRQEWVHL